MSELKVTTLKHADSAVDSIVMASDGTLAFGAAVADSAGVAVKGGVPAQAWVNFDGTTNTGGNCDVRASYNVSSVTDNGTGDYSVNFTTAMVDANYVVVGSSSSTAGDYRTLVPNFNAAPTTTTCRVRSSDKLTSSVNDSFVNVAIFR